MASKTDDELSSSKDDGLSSSISKDASLQITPSVASPPAALTPDVLSPTQDLRTQASESLEASESLLPLGAENCAGTLAGPPEKNNMKPAPESQLHGSGAEHCAGTLVGPPAMDNMVSAPTTQLFHGRDTEISTLPHGTLGTDPTMASPAIEAILNIQNQFKDLDVLPAASVSEVTIITKDVSRSHSGLETETQSLYVSSNTSMDCQDTQSKMGKKLDALLGRTFKTKKFKALLNLALTRLSILKNQRQVRCSQATSDVTELLKLGQHENAYHRVDQVIKDQNTLDVLFFIHGYFTLLLDRVHLFEHNRDCPDELLEAVSSLLFAASRIGEFPELQEIRNVLVSRFGKDIAARSIELRSNCGVNPKIIQKLSTRHPPREARMKVLKEIAAENNIVLKLEEASSTSTEGQGQSDVSKAKLTNEVGEDEIGEGYGLSDLVKRGKQKYKDVADAAQAAFESAAHAAVAARAAVELCQFSPCGPDNTGNNGGGSSSSGSGNNKTEQEANDDGDLSKGEVDVRSESKKSISDPEDTIEDVMSLRENPVKLLEKDDVLYDSEEETKQIAKTNTTTEVKDEESLKDCSERADAGHVEDVDLSEGEVDVRSESKKSISDTDDNIEDVMSFREDPVKLLEKAFVVYDSEEETKHNAKTNTTTEVKNEESLMDGSDRADAGHVDNMVHSVEEAIIRKAILKGPISVRTRQVRGY
ncbi:hypothetical protein Bca101_069537 [Brassica carinata]